MPRPVVSRILLTAALGLPLAAVPVAASAAPVTGSLPARPADGPAAVVDGRVVAADQPTLGGVIPAPVEVKPAAGADFRLGPLTVIRTPRDSAAVRAIGHQLARALRPATGYPLPVIPAGSRDVSADLSEVSAGPGDVLAGPGAVSGGSGDVSAGPGDVLAGPGAVSGGSGDVSAGSRGVLATASSGAAAMPHGGALPTISLLLGAGEARLGGEGYRLSVGPRAVIIQANRPAGLFAGTQTLLQLLPREIDSPRLIHRSWRAPGGTIVDYPRFSYRGTMLDLARHFHTPDEIKRHIDEISRFKVNHLHLHLSDDQGWRIQIDSWPRLTTIGGGPGTGVDGAGPGYLSKAAYRDLVAYAAARYVTIVPEIDMPGHVNAAQVAYPELTCDGVAPEPRTDTAVGYSSLCISAETTYRFAEDVIRELAALTPGPYLHIGGDEAHATTDADYLAFQRRVLPLVAKYGKTAYGWNEIAKSPAAATAVAQYWDSATVNPTVAAAVANGTRVVLSPANQAYLDMKYDRNTPLGLSWAGYIEVRTAYDWDPAARIAGVAERSILGVEAPLWSETLRTLDDIEFMAFPRLPAIAELGWSPATSHDWPSFATRLGAYGPRWTSRGVNYYPSPQINWS